MDPNMTINECYMIHRANLLRKTRMTSQEWDHVWKAANIMEDSAGRISNKSTSEAMIAASMAIQKALLAKE